MLAITSLFFIVGIIIYFLRRSQKVSEDELQREEENQAYLELNSDEQELYFQSKDYLQNNPYFVGDLSASQNLSIQEKGISAFEFVKDAMLTFNDLLVVNKTELNFFKNFECSTQTNIPIPMKNEVYYFESKIYSLPNPEETLIAIGLSIKPYPWFRLPGRHAQSVSYDSNGYRRYNQPFRFTNEPPFPKLAEGDVVGVGYRTRSGTIFFTRNGKKVSETKIGGHIRNFKIKNHGQIFPTVGANNICSVHVNLGQRGFVFIEGNVKNWGYAPIEGTGPSPPVYNKFNSDILLERSEVGDDDDFSDRENDFPPDFWTSVKNGEEANNNNNNNEEEEEEEEEEEDDDEEGKGRHSVFINQDKFSYNAYSEANSNDERITLNSLVPPHKPPSYNEEHIKRDEREEEGEDGDEVVAVEEGEDVEEEEETETGIASVGPSSSLFKT
ncbi:ssh4 [Candida oxycetoniae]|uniref:Ssh4 n=1 Tax=Candida oxycetoniae TaxID=497107 RepID=A0AAI9SUZ3_9ASCO|nr:ssh4 [Candida oxycetoniae]KAI3403361.1 ssh4 [Candida oxycetoniae]